MNLDGFFSEWSSRRVADPTLGSVGLPENQWFQCVSYVKQYLRECYGIEAGFWGNAITWWTNPPAPLQTRFERLETQDPARGDIVILRTAGRSDYNGEGHIGIATGAGNSTQSELSEQNGETGNGSGLNGDAIRTRYINRSRIAGVYRPIQVVVAPQGPAYEVIHRFSPGKCVSINKPTYRWNLGYHDFEEMRNHAMAEIVPPNNFQVVALARHINGNDYYMDNENEASGFHVADCDDYTPPTPKPPAPPVPVPLAEKYELVTSVFAFATVADASADRNAIQALGAGSYYVYKRDLSMLNLTKDNMKLGLWINPKHNVKEESDIIPVTVAPKAEATPIVPVPEPIEPTPTDTVPKLAMHDISALLPDWRPVRYKATNHQAFKIYDLETKEYIALLTPGQSLHLVGTFQFDNRLYGVTQAAYRSKVFTGIPMGFVRVDYWGQFLTELRRVKSRVIDGVMK